MGITTSQNPNTPEGLKQRLSVGIHRIPIELPHSSKLEPRNLVGPRRISAELPCSSYEEDPQQARRPSSPQSLTTLPTRLRLATTLRMGALQVESPKCGVCVCRLSFLGGIYGQWGSSTNLAKAVTRQVATVRPSHVVDRPMSSASTDFLQHHSLPLLM
jgi:hypothetical protein